MEHVNGIELERLWDQMPIEKQLVVVRQLVDHQKTWSSFSFNKFGSLYFTEDISNPQPMDYRKGNNDWITDKRFAIDASVGREWFDDMRADVEVDRGPWNTIRDYHIAIGHRESQCIASLPQLPLSPVSLSGPGLYHRDRSMKLKAIDAYLSLLPGLIPADDKLTMPSMWHNDLHEGNIFVDLGDHTKIVSIIDWLSTDIRPRYICARQPALLDYDGPRMEGLNRPSIPANLSALDPTEQKKAKSLFLQQSLCSLYRTLIHRQVPDIQACFDFQETANFDLLLLARNLWVDGEGPYLSQVIDLEKEWQTLVRISTTPDMKWPLRFSKADKAAIATQTSANIKGIEVLEAIKSELGDLWPEKGIVRHD
ncbi:hypothetical protein ANO11243_066870 [Dothideomycetidae sp. 11243]|nr:hypothetical protein ANO11243_066870 [fungal sp. No.11243]